ncbi:MAG: hypothetical protein ACPG5T_09010, partial [Endozoicomonas sp.]
SVFKNLDEHSCHANSKVEVFYNRQRKHSTNGYLAPFVYEQNLAKAKKVSGIVLPYQTRPV